MFHAPALDNRSQPPALHAKVALLSVTHFMLAAAIALSAHFGTYGGGDWTWWLSRASARKLTILRPRCDRVVAAVLSRIG